jgi:hypothetical protein
MTHPMTHPMAHPMSCAECLRLVATAGVAELTSASAVAEHCRTCPDCARVVDEVAEEERRFADLLDGTAPGVDARVVALRAVADSARARRRHAARLWVAGGAGAVLVALVAVMSVRTVAPPPTARAHVLLRCLTSAQAVQLVRAALPPDLQRATMLRISPQEPIPMVYVSGQPGEVAAVERRLEEIDVEYGPRYNPSCSIGPGLGEMDAKAAEQAAAAAAAKAAMAAEAQAAAAAKAAAKADMEAAKAAAKEAAKAAKAAAKAGQ